MQKQFLVRKSEKSIINVKKRTTRLFAISMSSCDGLYSDRQQARSGERASD